MTHRTAYFGPKNNMEVGASCESERCNLTDAIYYLCAWPERWLYPEGGYSLGLKRWSHPLLNFVEI